MIHGLDFRGGPLQQRTLDDVDHAEEALFPVAGLALAGVYHRRRENVLAPQHANNIDNAVVAAGRLMKGWASEEDLRLEGDEEGGFQKARIRLEAKG